MAISVIPDSHLDHSLTDQQRAYVLMLCGDKDGFFIQTITLPTELGTAPCALLGPLTGGDPVKEGDVFYTKRGDRAGESRMIASPPAQTALVTIVAGPHGDMTCVLYTMYAGPAAPREPWDKTLETDEQKSESTEFWAQHALSSEEFQTVGGK